MAVYSSTTGWIKPRVNRGARNAHLLPEIKTRIDRIITGARAETAVANRALETYVELWHKLRNGRKCTCTQDKHKEEVERQVDQTGFRLEDFLTTGNLEFSFSKEFCPLCFSTGYVGGYRQSGVDSIVLDASLRPNLEEVYLVKQKPWWLRAGPSYGTASWEVTIPQYFKDAIGVFVRWKNRPPREWGLTINDEPLSLDLLNSLCGEKVTISLMMRDNSTEDDETGLIGIWIQLEVTNALVPAELPNLAKSFSGSFSIYEEVTNSITVNFDGTQGEITPSDVFIDQKGYCWRIIQVEEDSTLPINIDYACEARLVRAFENYYILPSKLARQKYPMTDYSIFA